MINFTQEFMREMVKEAFLDETSAFKESKPYKYINMEPIYNDLKKWLNNNYSDITLDDIQHVEMDMGSKYIAITWEANHDRTGWGTISIDSDFPLEKNAFTNISFHDKEGGGGIIN
jgi:hypothetical protein